MVTIVNRRPKLLGLKGMLEAFVKHQKEVVKRRTQFDLETAQKDFTSLMDLLNVYLF